MDLEVVHVGGQKLTAKVIGFSERALFIKFPQSLTSVYMLRVNTNRFTGLPNWKAADHERVREVYRLLTKERNERIKEGRYA